MLVWGSTLSVTLASDLCAEQETLVICNRQCTDRHCEAAIRCFGDCDQIMALLLEQIMGDQEYKKWLKDVQNDCVTIA